MGRHPVQLSLDPPTAETCLLHGIKSGTSKPNLAICFGPARQILAPESGNMFISTDWEFFVQEDMIIRWLVFFACCFDDCF